MWFVMVEGYILAYRTKREAERARAELSAFEGVRLLPVEPHSQGEFRDRDDQTWRVDTKLWALCD